MNEPALHDRARDHDASRFVLSLGTSYLQTQRGASVMDPSEHDGSKNEFSSLSCNNGTL